jgi:hypothetical protein
MKPALICASAKILSAILNRATSDWANPSKKHIISKSSTGMAVATLVLQHKEEK